MSDYVGFYQTREQAESVKSELVAAGYDHVSVHGSTAGKSDTSLWEDIKSAFGFADEDEQSLYAEATRRGSVAVGLKVDDAASADKAIAIMQRHQPLDLNAQSQQWRLQGWTGKHVGAAAATATTAAATTTKTAAAATGAMATGATAKAGDVLSVVEEELKVGKREVQGGGVRVHTRVTERPVEEQVNLREERVTIERRPVDRPVTAADNVFQERSIEVTERSEEAVVSKTARVVEEVVVGKTAEQRTETIRDSVRRTDVDVEKIDADPRYAPAREFATELASDARYKGRAWDDVESDARTSFEQRHPGKWSEFRDAIRSTYDRGAASSKTRSNA